MINVSVKCLSLFALWLTVTHDHGGHSFVMFNTGAGSWIMIGQSDLER